MSFQKKQKKRTTTDYWGDEPEPQYTPEQQRRIASYLKENDENCKESTTLILIIVIGILVALSIVGFLAIRNSSSVKYKGSHTTYEHGGGGMTSNTTFMNLMWSKWNWLQALYFGLNVNRTNESEEIRAIVALEEELDDFQPIYRNPLLQQLYAADINDVAPECNDASDGSVYKFISIKHGSWVPSAQYLQEALDFSWSDFESQEEKEEIELVRNLDKKDETEKDQEEKEALKKQIESDRQKRNQEKQKQKRRLLANNINAALPNPANILLPQSMGDQGAGDVEAHVLRGQKLDELKKQFPKGVIPEWMKQKGALAGGKSAHGAFDPRKELPIGNRQHLKRLDEIRDANRGKNKKRPQDILAGIDLTKFGINKAVNDETSDKEKRADLEKLEEEGEKRHPFMTLLTNPGEMSDVKCMEHRDRRHEVVFKPMNDATTSDNKNDDGKKRSMFAYNDNVLMWYCYLVEIELDAMTDLMSGGGYFKVNLSFSDVNMETGFDYVNVYINSMITDAVSGIGLNWEGYETHATGKNEAHPQFVYYMDRNYVERHGNAMEVCMKMVTDASIIKKGFTSTLTVDYDDPQVSQWTKWSKCNTAKPVGKNNKFWDGNCGIGVRRKNITKCVDPASLNLTSQSVAPCTLRETRKEYCVKANCYDWPLAPERRIFYNGHGRIDPDFADPFLVQRSSQASFNMTRIISELSAVRDEIRARYPDDSGRTVLGAAVINHDYMDQSKLRLGIRLARSLLLGDTFTVYTTGSSNTAGHQNMFISTWPVQLQSIMRPVWRRVGYKGAAFVVKNHAEGGSVSTTQLAPCIPSLIGEDADVVFWESQMNDHGDAVSHAVENHFRNAITLPRRPLYHVMHAGKNGPSNTYPQEESKNGKEGAFRNNLHCYGWLCGKRGRDGKRENGLLHSAYTDFGSGVTQFYPTAGLGTLNRTKYKEYRDWWLYVSWHPGSTGHRIYAEMVANYYLTCVLETFADIRDLIDDLETAGEPIEAMLEILEDPPRTKQIPHDHVANQCDPVCTNATEAVCISGYETLGEPRYSLKRWREKDSPQDDVGKWKYDDWMRNRQPFGEMNGEQGSCDTKNRWETKTSDSNELKFIFEAKQYGYVSIEGDKLPEFIAQKVVEMRIYEIDMQTGEMSHNPQYKEHGKPLQCYTGGTLKDNWMEHGNGCSIGGLKPYQKYEIVFNVVTNDINGKTDSAMVKNIRIF